MIPAKVLIVEDERIVARHLRQRLSLLGYQVSIATGGLQALDQISNYRPDVVLMDINIEGDIDGIETSARIPAGLQVPVIYLTAYSEEATLERARKTQPHGYLVKPFSERELHATIQMALERRRADAFTRDDGRSGHPQADAIVAANHETGRQQQGSTENQQASTHTLKMEVIGQLTAGIAHDFSNLLAVIGGGLEFVEEAAKQGLAAEPELIEAAQRAARRGSELVRRLVTFTHQAPAKAQPTAVDRLILETVRLLYRVLGEDIEIVMRLDAKGSIVATDRSQFATALLSLFLNARENMPKGGRLVIATSCQPIRCGGEAGAAYGPAGQEVCIALTEDVIGFADDDR